MGIRLNGNDTKVFNTRHVQHLGLLTLLTIKEQQEKKINLNSFTILPSIHRLTQ